MDAIRPAKQVDEAVAGGEFAAEEFLALAVVEGVHPSDVGDRDRRPRP